MHQNTVSAIALTLLLVSFPLISFGTEQGLAAVWGLGLLFIVVGGLIPPVIRFVGPGADAQGDDADDGTRDGTAYVNYGSSDDDTGTGVLPTGRPPHHQPERAHVQRERAQQVGAEDDGEKGDRNTQEPG
jgi:hypothetical protein